MKKISGLGLLIFLAFSDNGHCIEDELPKINEVTLQGIWEGINHYVFYQMEINEDIDNSYLVIVPGPATDFFLYKLKSIRIDDDQLFLLFLGTKYNDIVHIIGKGNADKEEGYLEVDLIINPDGEYPRRWNNTVFIKDLYKNSYIDILYECAQLAKKAISNEKGK